jgi:hypothetical protein
LKPRGWTFTIGVLGIVSIAAGGVRRDVGIDVAGVVVPKILRRWATASRLTRSTSWRIRLRRFTGCSLRLLLDLFNFNDFFGDGFRIQNFAFILLFGDVINLLDDRKISDQMFGAELRPFGLVLADAIHEDASRNDECDVSPNRRIPRKGGDSVGSVDHPVGAREVGHGKGKGSQDS